MASYSSYFDSSELDELELSSPPDELELSSSPDELSWFDELELSFATSKMMDNLFFYFLPYFTLVSSFDLLI